MKTPSVIRFLQSAALFCLFGAVLAFPTQQALSAPAPVKGRYVRVENPTGWVMVWRQIQIFSDGKEVLRGHPELFSGTVYPDHDIKTRDGAEITDGNLDTSQRGSYFPASLSETDLNPWFEVDLGEMTNIDKIVLYAAEYPSRQYRDKGDRVVTVLDGDRKVIWATKWKYYDAARYPKGVFTFEPNTSEKVLLAGKTLPEKVGGWIPMGWLLDAEEITSPADAVERMARFSKRNSPAELEKLAKEFFPLLDQKMPELAAARQLYLAEKYGEALESWKTYWFAKMKLLNGHTAVHTEYSSYYTQGEDLTNGIMVSISANSARAMRFIPGKIHWINLPDAKDDPALRTALVDCEQKAQVGKVSRPLLDAYRRDPDAKYLKMWAEIMDDWSMNFFQDATKTPYEVENLFTFNPCNQWGNMMEDLSDAAVEHPEAIALIPAATLARVQLLALEKYSTAWWYQNRYTTFIHITSGLCAWDIVLP